MEGLKRVMNLQLFAEDDGFEDKEFDEGEEGSDGDGGEYTGNDNKVVTMTQAEFEAALERRLARNRSATERELSKIFGTKDLRTAGEYYQVGRVLAQSTGKTPAEIMQRLSQQGQYGRLPFGQQQPAADLHREIQELKEMFSSQHELTMREKEEAEARKEFGALFDQHYEDILDKAEERNLSMVDAAAIVLRPKLRELAEERVRARREVQRKKKVDGTEGAPSGSVDYSSKLTAEMKRVAQRQGISFKEYYEQAKITGLISE